MKNIGRNDPCPCNSGKKYRKCCGQIEKQVVKPANVATLPANAIQTAQEYHQAGRLAQAETIYRQILQKEPNHPDALHFLGVIAYQVGNTASAIELFRDALRFKPDNAEIHNNLGVALKDHGKPDDAVISYRQALALKPDYAQAHNNLGLVLKDQGKINDAVASYQQALTLKPDYAEAHFNLGNALQEEGRLTEAVAAYRKALTFKPDYAEAHNNLGNQLKEQGRLTEAIGSYLQALMIKPDYAEAHNNLGLIRHTQGKLTEAVASYRQALLFKPDYAEAHNNLGLALQDQGKLDAAIACYRQALKIKADFAGAHSNQLFCLNYQPDLSAEAIFAEYRRWNELHARPLHPQAVTHGHNRDPERRLRIGYVSPDLRKHATLHFIEPLLDHHDKTQVEVYAYAQVAAEDNISAQLKKYTDHWRNTSGMSDDKMAEMIRSDGIDILVDLAGHTANNRLLVFARKPAPIQVSWMGYGYTTGLDAMDYFLSDQEFTPPGCEALFSEKLVRLPVAGVYRPAQDMGEPGPLPALKTGIITLGTLSRSIRINHRVVRAWAAILRCLPNTRLMINSLNFRSTDMQRSIQTQFSAHGIAANRLVTGYESPPWDVLRQIDISLDCFPHNSGTTLWESLYMGIPFVTLAGRPSVGRSGSAALMKINHPEWIAASEQEYLDKAVALASDIDALTLLRAELRSKMEASLLMDEAGFARSLETAYRTMWQRWCNGLAPANIGK